MLAYYYALLKKEKINDLEQVLSIRNSGWKELAEVNLDGVIQRLFEGKLSLSEAVRMFKSKLEKDDLEQANFLMASMTLKRTDHKQINISIPVWQSLVLDKVKVFKGVKSHVIQVAFNNLLNKVGKKPKDIIKYVNSQIWSDSVSYAEDWSGETQKSKDEAIAKRKEKAKQKRLKKPLPKIEKKVNPKLKYALSGISDELRENLEGNPKKIREIESHRKITKAKPSKKKTKKKKKTFKEEFPTASVSSIIDEVFDENENMYEDEEDIPGLNSLREE